VLALAALFPEGGFEPYPVLSFAATTLVVLTFLWALPARQPLLRLGALVYLLACVLFLAIHTPMGSNIERYGVLLAGPLLLCAVAQDHSLRGRRPMLTAALALCVAAVWVAWGPVRETLAVAGNESTQASYYVPVERFLANVQAPPASPVRVEVPFTRSHWEAALLAPTVSLARGWEKQLDTRFDGVLLVRGLTASAYERWLDGQAVSYVALPDTPLDPSSAQEGRLIRRGLPFLQKVFASRHWTVYRVLAPTPLASGPGRLTSLGNDSFSLRATSAGSFLVRVHYTRFWTLAKGDGCVAEAPSGWTSVTARAAGTVVVVAHFSLERALGLGSSCKGSPST
jgi:DNA-binding beta-propeller fold protein YncE